MGSGLNQRQVSILSLHIAIRQSNVHRLCHRLPLRQGKMAHSRAQLVKHYPNMFDQTLISQIGCVDDFTLEEAEQYFKRICFHNISIVHVEKTKNNHQPRCVWRVYYKLINPDLDVHDGKSGAEPLPDDEQSLKTLFLNITALCENYGGLKVVQKQIYCNEEKECYAVVEYSPKHCVCICQNFDMVAKEPRMRPTLSEVEIGLYLMKLAQVD